MIPEQLAPGIFIFLEEPMETCTVCNTPYPSKSLTEFDDELLCHNCLERETVLCHNCGERIRIDNNAGTPDFPLCVNCYESNYTTCDRCGRLIRNDDANSLPGDDYVYCEECFNILNSESDIVHDYYYKSSPIFYGEGPRFFGVELEIDDGGESDDNVRALSAVSNADAELIYCKHDGSLDDGFEIVTHPMSLPFHEHEMPWKSILEKAPELGYRSHQTDTCGLHIHVSRNAFGIYEDEQDKAIARVLYFVERNWNELLIFARRTQRQLDRWASRYGYKDRPSEMLEHVKKGGSRYTCVNLSNWDTIEFRIFRGTLKLNTLIATLQIVDHICSLAMRLSDDEIKNLSWSGFVGSVNDPELIQYLKERKLYIYDPVESEVEL